MGAAHCQLWWWFVLLGYFPLRSLGGKRNRSNKSSVVYSNLDWPKQPTEGMKEPLVFYRMCQWPGPLGATILAWTRGTQVQHWRRLWSGVDELIGASAGNTASPMLPGSCWQQPYSPERKSVGGLFTCRRLQDDEVGQWAGEPGVSPRRSSQHKKEIRPSSNCAGGWAHWSLACILWASRQQFKITVMA